MRFDFCPPINLERVSISYSQKLHYFLVTMRRDLSCYRVFHCFLIPPYVLLSRCQCQLYICRYLGKLLHLSLLSRYVKTVIFISKIIITKTHPILHFVPIWTYNILYCPKKEKLLSFGMSQPFLSILVV